MMEEKDILIGEGRTLDRPISDLEKLHIIVGYALSRRDIRDEIYCQIIKQLVNNKNQKSSLRGWVLLSICLGIFPPTELIMQVRLKFTFFHLWLYVLEALFLRIVILNL
uniref:MyTH4 domain-containing protein n=1 Tax=Hucho hucho TaxID=62062 RepID=A0A4W5QH22_9TELE